MNKNNQTLGLYAIQDRVQLNYPFNVHDHSLVLFKVGKIIKFIQQERISGIKNDNKLNSGLYSILKSEKLINASLNDIIFVDNVIGRAFISNCGNIRFEAPLNNSISKSYEKGNCWWFDKNINGYVLNHELAHIFSCIPFYGNFKENSLLIHFDGGASKSNFSVWIFNKNKLKLIDYHWKFKYLSSFFNANALCFSIIGSSMVEQNSVPGKLMGLSAYGKYNNDIEKWLKLNNYFSDIWNNKKQFFQALKVDWNIHLNYFDTHHPFLQDIIASF